MVKQVKLQRLQNLSQTNGDNLYSVRLETTVIQLSETKKKGGANI